MSTPAASAVLRPPPPVEPPLHSLLRDSPPTVRSAGAVGRITASSWPCCSGRRWGWAWDTRRGDATAFCALRGATPAAATTSPLPQHRRRAQPARLPADEPSTGRRRAPQGRPPPRPVRARRPPRRPIRRQRRRRAPTAPTGHRQRRPRPATCWCARRRRARPCSSTTIGAASRRWPLQNVELGTRRVRIQRDGFTVEERQVNLTRSRPSRSVDVRLDPCRASRADARAGAGARRSRRADGEPGHRVAADRRDHHAQRSPDRHHADDRRRSRAGHLHGAIAAGRRFRPIRTTVRVVAGARARAAASLVSAQEPQ